MAVVTALAAGQISNAIGRDRRDIAVANAKTRQNRVEPSATIRSHTKFLRFLEENTK